MVVFRQKWFYSGKVVVLRQGGCICANSCIRAKVVVFVQSGCIRAKVVLFGQSGCIQAKVVLFGQSGCIKARWLYLCK